MPRKPPKRPRKLDDILAERRAKGIEPNNTDWFEPAPPPPPANGGKRAGSNRPAHFYAAKVEGYKALNAQQLRFCQEFPKDMDATAAMIRAGYAENTAQNNGQVMLRHPLIAAELARIFKSMDKKLVMNAEEALREATRLARSTMGEVLHQNGVPIPWEDMSDDTKACIQKCKVRVERNEEGEEVATVYDIELWSKPKVLELMMKHHRLIDPEPVNVVVLTDADREAGLRAFAEKMRAKHVLAERAVDATEVGK